MVPESKPKRICFIVVPAIALVAATMNTRSGRGSPEPRHGKPATCHRRAMRISGGVSTESEANAHREWRGPAGQKAGEVPSDPAPAPGRSENSFFRLIMTRLCPRVSALRGQWSREKFGAEKVEMRGG